MKGNSCNHQRTSIVLRLAADGVWRFPDQCQHEFSKGYSRVHGWVLLAGGWHVVGWVRAAAKRAGAMQPILAGGREPNARGRTMTKSSKPLTLGGAESQKLMKIYSDTLKLRDVQFYLEVCLVETRIFIDSTAWQPFIRVRRSCQAVQPSPSQRKLLALISP